MPFDQLHRREVISLLGGAAAAWPLAAGAQQPAMPVIGILYGGSSDSFAYLLTAIRRGLRESGYIEGRNMAIEYRWAEDRYDRVPALADDLVRRQVHVIVAIGGGGYVAQAAKAATATIPIVFTTNLDPVKSGLVASLNHPGGNATGMSFFGSLLEPKKFELMHELAPKTSAIAILVNPNNPNTESTAKIVKEAADALGRSLVVATASTDREIESAYASVVERRAGGIIVAADPFFNSARATCRAVGTPCDASDLRMARVRRARRSDELRKQHHRRVSPNRYLHRPDSQGREVRRPARSAAGQTRAGGQPEDCQDA